MFVLIKVWLVMVMVGVKFYPTKRALGLLQFKDEDYEVATATTVDEVKQLAQAGFQKFDELNGIHVFRKPKKFSA
jgi:hypothetical protein